MNIYSRFRLVVCFLVMTSSLAEVNKSLPAHFLDAFLVILWFLDIPNYAGMFDYIKGKQPAAYFKNKKKTIVAYHL